MSENCDIIIVAGGSGTRFGGELPKQFEPIHGKPLVLWSLEVFASWEHAGRICVVVPEVWVAAFKESLSILINQDRILVCPGGAVRQESVENGLRALNSQASWVFVHDAARPAVNEELLNRLWASKSNAESLGVGAVIPGLPVRETIKRVKKNGAGPIVSETLNREDLYTIQTPQLIRVDILSRALELHKGFNAPDDACLIEKMGYKVVVVEGSHDNVKVTYPEDRQRVSNWLRERYPSL
ncbi:MAG: 2-C-methyl-D-erythritol 4-phosphate cytidylyltransferase [Oligoflexia bacterium]|nr:2-C-methyl-D-erythritol 4-phosphate cytidylyltransferase [Oligoflexia bacterium]